MPSLGTWLTLAILALGPLLAPPLLSGVWTYFALSDPDYALLAALGAAIVAAIVEYAVLRRAGLLRDVAVFLLSGFWTVLLYLAWRTPGYDWTSPPPWIAPGPVGLMAIMAGMLAYVALYGFVAAKR